MPRLFVRLLSVLALWVAAVPAQADVTLRLHQALHEKLTAIPSLASVLSDIEMPGHSGIELAQYVQQHKLSTKVIIITTFGRAGYVKRAMDAAVGGFLLKDAPVEQLVQAIHQVMAGKRVVDSELLLNSLGEQDPLSDKERQALRLAADGQSTSEIAAALYIAEGTARNYLSEAISKLNAANRIDAARIARQKGWL